MTKRIINKALIRKLVKEQGVEQTAVAARCSASLVWKLMSDEHKTIPAIGKIDGLCFALNRTIDELFPLVSEAEKESA
jgi:transcriptional regulator with XRE-family HTH domain